MSKYSGGFALLDSMRIPRPCAYKSYNLTSANYYRGQNTYSYKISYNNTHTFVVTMMTEKTPKILFQNGRLANPIIQPWQRSIKISMRWTSRRTRKIWLACSEQLFGTVTQWGGCWSSICTST